MRFFAWKRSPKGFVKVNVDAATKANLGELATSGLCRDDQGCWLFGFTRQLGIGHITKAELYTIFTKLNLA